MLTDNCKSYVKGQLVHNTLPQSSKESLECNHDRLRCIYSADRIPLIQSLPNLKNASRNKIKD